MGQSEPPLSPPLADVELAESHGGPHSGGAGARSVGVMDVDNVAEAPVLSTGGQPWLEEEVRVIVHDVDLVAADGNVLVDVDNDEVEADTGVETAAEAAAESMVLQHNADGCKAALPRGTEAIGNQAAAHIEPGNHVAVGREAAAVVVAKECMKFAASGLC